MRAPSLWQSRLDYKHEAHMGAGFLRQAFCWSFSAEGFVEEAWP